MRSNFKSLAKWILTFALLHAGQSNAQSSSISLSGKFGCLVNKNFAGFDAGLVGSTRVGYHYMLHFDLTTKTSQIISIHLIDNYGKSNVTTNWAPGASATPVGNGAGILEVKENPNFPGAFLIRSTSTGDNNTKWTTTYVAMSVNNGNTLMISSGAGGNADNEPFTGVCQKI